jgi:hypothetical protein
MDVLPPESAAMRGDELRPIDPLRGDEFSVSVRIRRLNL